MAIEAVVDVHLMWLKEEERLMKRIHNVICGSGDGPFEKDTGYKWMLDNSNNWWAEIREGKLIIVYRYGHGNEERINTLVAFLRVWLA